MHYQIINLETHKATEEMLGSLSVFEGARDVPFEVKRFYYTYGVSRGEVRGHHAHRSLWQMLFCPYGAVKITMDDGHTKEEVLLDDASRALLLGPGVWHTMEWMQEGSVLCVAASDYYNEDDYIRDYAAFVEFTQKRREERDTRII